MGLNINYILIFIAIGFYTFATFGIIGLMNRLIINLFIIELIIVSLIAYIIIFFSSCFVALKLLDKNMIYRSRRVKK